MIDTAPNYGLGEAEQLIGTVLHEFNREDFFLMTKAGYMQGIPENDLRKFAGLSRSVAEISPGQYYCIHPDVLKYQLSSSLSRLKTSYVDGFFSHNPHYLIGCADLDQQLFRAMEFLEEQVSRKIIRYYGVSSSSLSVDPQSALNLTGLEATARMVSHNNHLKLFQFPLNLIENDNLKYRHGNLNLLEYTKKIGFKTFSNRPLNAYLPNGKFIRLAQTRLEENIQAMDCTMEFNISYAKISENLSSRDCILPAEWVDLPKIWKEFSSPELVTIYFRSSLLPGLTNRKRQHPPWSLLSDLRHLEKICVIHTLKSMKDLTEQFFKTVFPDLDLPHEDFAKTALQYCQLKGVDCVLTSAGKITYLNEIKDLL